MRRLVLVAELSVDGFLDPDWAEYDDHDFQLYRRRVLQKAGVLVREDDDEDIAAVTAMMAEGGHEELAPVVVLGPQALQRELSRLGLVDEYRVIVHPVVLGEGERFFAARERLHLITSRFFANGSTAHAYVPERAYRDHPPPLPWALSGSQGSGEHEDDAQPEKTTQAPAPGGPVGG